MRHQQYREGLLERLKSWRLSNIDGTLEQAKNELRSTLTQGEIDLLFDNWININFERVEITELKPGSVVATIRSRRVRSREEMSTLRKTRDAVAQSIASYAKDTMYEDFRMRIWDTILPNGVVLADATGKDIEHASGWFTVLRSKIKPNEKVINKFTTRQLYDLSLRFSSKAA
jgi:hypothetical protein